MSNHMVNGPADGPKVIFGKENKNWAGAKRAVEGNSAASDVNSARGDFGNTGYDDADDFADDIVESLNEYEKFQNIMKELQDTMQEELHAVKAKYEQSISIVSEKRNIQLLEVLHDTADSIKENPDWYKDQEAFNAIVSLYNTERDEYYAIDTSPEHMSSIAPVYEALSQTAPTTREQAFINNSSIHDKNDKNYRYGSIPTPRVRLNVDTLDEKADTIKDLDAYLTAAGSYARSFNENGEVSVEIPFYEGQSPKGGVVVTPDPDNPGKYSARNYSMWEDFEQLIEKAWENESLGTIIREGAKLARESL